MNNKHFSWILIFFLSLNLLISIGYCAPSNTPIKGFINDYANIIDKNTQIQIENLQKELYDNNVAQYSIVTINSLDGQDIESYSYKLAENNLGDKEKNNGLLLLVSLQDRKYRFEVGRGIEPILNDAKVGRIGRYYLIPNFKDENYSKGIYEASLAIKTTLMNENNSFYYVGDSSGSTNENEKISAFIFLIILIIIIKIFLNYLIAKKKGNFNDDDDKYFIAGAIISEMLRGGSGGSSGGFGGFGGGSFGGGGSSRGW